MVAVLPVVLALLAPPASVQDKAAATDWAATIRKAHEHRRMMVRRAAANKLAAAGDPAIAAVRAFERQHGRNQLALELVAAYGQTKASGPATVALLEEWARDREFFWRSQALEALANRRLPRFRTLFTTLLSDPSYLTRIQAGRGLCRLGPAGPAVLALLDDPHPTVRVRVAACMAEEKDDRGLPVLVSALAWNGAFFDYPWGQLAARTAFRTLRQVAGNDFDYQLGASAGDNAAAVARFAAFARQRLGAAFRPVAVFQDPHRYLGGVAIRSCRNGDLFVRITDAHAVVAGLEPGAGLPLPADVARSLLAALPKPTTAIHGKVVCDYLRLMWSNPTVDRKFAPQHLQGKVQEWLEKLATALEKNSGQDLARQIRSRLDQFVRPRTP